MKIKRQNKIIEIIQNHKIETQEELAKLLKEAGFRVTQATISRDIRELNITKANTGDGHQNYIVLGKQDRENKNARYVRVLKEGFISMDIAQNLLVVKTVSGMAMAVAAALDDLKISEIVGCIAGDDTILCVIKTAEEAARVMEQLNKIIR